MTDKHIHGMVDNSEKDVTKRVALASATITLSPDAYKILANEGSPKGDVFEIAKVAGVLAAKATPSIIPLCHPLEVNKVKITYERDAENCSVTVFAEVVYRGRTGVEMEALCAASAATLTIYDMMKWADKGMVISQVQLLKKSGGKSGDYIRN